jgi:lanosterol synthase
MGSGCRRGLKGFLTRVGEYDIYILPSLVREGGEEFEEEVTDVFLGSMITYPNYKFYFPIKALGMYMKRYGDEELL